MNNQPTQQLQPGTTLQNDKYRIEKILGQGGFGITYLATQDLLNRRVAIKEFFMRDFCNRAGDTHSVTLGTASNRELMERYLAKFMKEAQVISQLDHPNIVRIHDIFMENGTAYYVMDYIEGESLSLLVKRCGALTEQEAMAYIRNVAEALKYVHRQRINHLDVKPGNIVVQRTDNRIFLLDFGMSKRYDADGNQTSSTPLGISHGYAPIEQYSPGGIKEFSPQTDIYSLGATLYYLLTAITPPAAGELLTAPLEGFPPTLSPAVREAIKKAMQVRKQDRPATVEQFEALLQDSKETEEEATKAIEEKSGEETHLLNPAKVNAAPKKSVSDICDKGIAAFNKKHYEKAFNLFRQAAEQGDAKGQYNLGVMYDKGLGVPQNYPAAFEWYTKAAEQGNINAQNNLGAMYANGEGVKKDYAKAFEWYIKAVEQGDASAQFNLGVMYYNGSGVKQDYAKAIEWFTKAAKQGHALAQYHLGNLYCKGKGVAKDKSKAMEWYRKAAEQGNKDAENALKQLQKGFWGHLFN